MNTKTQRARRRALRAARTVTLGLAIMGCSMAHSPDPRPTEEAAPDAAPMTDAMVADSGTDSGSDAGLDAGERIDAGSDAGVLADAGPDCSVLADLADTQPYLDCCNANGWDWDRGCMAWGPYVPPGAMLPASRAAQTMELLGELA